MIARRAALLALLLAAGCSRCGRSDSAASAEELLPPATAGALTTAPLGTLAEHGALLVEKAKSLPGGEQLGDLRRALASQLGFDPLTREGLIAAGLDPGRGAAISFQSAQPDQQRPSWLIALPLSNADRFAQKFDQLARERAGFAQRTDQARGETRIALYDGGRTEKIAQAVVRGYGLVARGLDPAAAIAAAALPNRQNLAQQPGLAAAKSRLGAQDLLAFAPAGSDLPRRWMQRRLPGDLALGLSGTAQGLTARLFAQLPADDAQLIAALLPGGGGGLADLLPVDAPLRVRLGFASAQLPAQLGRIQPLAGALAQLRAAVKSAGADLDADLFGSLEPGLVFSLGVSPRISIAQAIDFGFLDWRHHSPFDTVQLVALAPVHDKARLLKALGAVAQSLPRLGANALRAGDDFAVSYAGGEGARFGVRSIGGKEVAYLISALSPDQLRAGGKSGAPALFAEPGASLQLDLGKLAQTLAALPETAYGSGPQSYVAHSLVNQVVLPLKPLRLELAAQPEKDGLTADLSLEIVSAKGSQ